MTEQATVDVDPNPVDASPEVAQFCELVVTRLLAGERTIADQIDDIDWELASPQDEGTPSLEQEIGHAVLTSYRHAVAASASVPAPAGSENGHKGEVVRRRPERVEVVGAVVDPSFFPRSPWTVTPRPVVATPEVDRPRRTILATGLLWAHKFRGPRVEAAEVDSAVFHRRRRLATGFAWVQNVGAILILFAGWQIWGTTITEHHAQASLQHQFEVAAQHHPKTTTPTTSPAKPTAANSPVTLMPASTQLPNPPEGSVVGKIQIPAIGVDEYVVSGTAAADLSMGPGHYVGTALPGQAGNVDIAGHRTTYGAPFYRLGQLLPGEPVELTTLSGQTLTYVVTGDPTVVSPSDTAILGYFGDNRLTLTTCTPPFSASHRLVVVAALKMPGPAGAPEKLSHVAPKPYRHLASSSTASWGWGSLPWVLLAGAMLIALGLLHRRFTRTIGRWSRWLVLAPLWVAGLYLLFQSLSGLLPASV